MTITDRAFFAAYGQPVTSEIEHPVAAKLRKSADSQAERQRSGPSIEKQYSDGSWYRIDQEHSDNRMPPTPHLEKRLPDEPAVETDEAGSWDTLTEWPASCFVMATPVSATETPTLVRPTPLREAAIREALRESSADEPQPVAESATPDTPPVRASELHPEEPTSTDVPETRDELTTSTSSVAAASGEPWTAQWEVDEFAWPEELVRLHETQTDYFRYAGEKLRDASREGLKTMAVVSTREKEGCTTMAICLARAAAAAGARVVLVDANLDHPELLPKLGLDFSHGWQDVIFGSTTLAAAGVMALDSTLTLLPLSASHRLASVNDARVSNTLREIAAAFDLVIVDAGVAPTGDVEMFQSGEACPINAALVVRDLRRTSETETLVTASRLKSLGIDAIGIAENFLPRPNSNIAAA